MPKVGAISEGNGAAPPEKIQPFIAHGVDFTRENYTGQAIGTCPFCNADAKFYVSESTGEWNCFDCGESGNVYTFLRKLHAMGKVPTGVAESLAADRGVLYPNTLLEWGLVVSPFTPHWMVPGYSVISREIVNLYRYLPDPKTRKYRLVATDSLDAAPLALNKWDDNKPDVILVEGLWNAMPLEEVLKAATLTGGTLALTNNSTLSLSANANILAIPGCKIFKESWCALLKGKRVFMVFDNDHPRTVKLKDGREVELPADALEGMKRAVEMMSRADESPKEVHYLHWGTDQPYDLTWKRGGDLRDLFNEAGTDISERIRVWGQLQTKFRPVPSEWLGGRTIKNGSVQLESIPCSDWGTLEAAWSEALEWTPGLAKTMAIMLSVCASTGHTGDQVWMKIMSPASSGKTTLCEALNVARKYVFPKSVVRGFHSGYKTDKEGKDDHSLILKARGKTLVIKDADPFMNSPNKDAILSELRDLFDRTSRSHFRHNLDRDYEDIDMTVIMCGTGALRQLDQSELGERFLCCYIMKGIDSVLERRISRRSAYFIRDNLGVMANGTTSSREIPTRTTAKQLTGGYINYLRENGSKLLKQIKMTDAAVDHCIEVGEFVTYMRSRPSKKQDESAEREFSPRISNQLTLLAACYTMVTNRREVDGEVLKVITQIARDSAEGRTLDICKHLMRVSGAGATTGQLAIWVSQDEAKLGTHLHFLNRIGVIEIFREEIAEGVQGGARWRLTNHVEGLYAKAMTDDVDVAETQDTSETPEAPEFDPTE
jgi:hypothetical protein